MPQREQINLVVFWNFSAKFRLECSLRESPRKASDKSHQIVLSWPLAERNFDRVESSRRKTTVATNLTETNQNRYQWPKTNMETKFQ